jgi:hypothetical protein
LDIRITAAGIIAAAVDIIMAAGTIAGVDIIMVVTKVVITIMAATDAEEIEH